jgi:hypothetical protein
MVAATDFPISFEADIESKELGKVVNLAFKSILIPIV